VRLDPTVQAIVFLAGRTVEVCILLSFWIVDEGKLAVSGWAPGDVLLHVNCLVKGKVAVLLVLFIVEQVL
jgi:hypothetical protein